MLEATSTDYFTRPACLMHTINNTNYNTNDNNNNKKKYNNNL